MKEQERLKLELDYDALNKDKKLEKMNISKEDYINATVEIRNMIVKYLFAQDVMNYYNQVKPQYISKIEPIDKTNDDFYNYNCNNRNPFKRVLKRGKKNK